MNGSKHPALDHMSLPEFFPGLLGGSLPIGMDLQRASGVVVAATQVDGSPVGLVADNLFFLNNRQGHVLIQLDRSLDCHVFVHNALRLGITVVPPKSWPGRIDFSGECNVIWNESCGGQPLMTGSELSFDVEVIDRFLSLDNSLLLGRASSLTDRS